MTENDTPLQTPIRVMIVDDHEIVRRGIAEIVDRADDLEVVAEAGTVQDALRRAQLVSPDVILVDLQLPDGTGIDIMESLGQTNPEIRPIVLTSFDDDEALAESLAKGARAYVLKTVRGAEITDVIKAGADVYVTGDIDHHTGIDTVAQGLALIDAGHYGTEYIFMDAMKKELTQAFPELKISCAEVKSPYTIL